MRLFQFWKQKETAQTGPVSTGAPQQEPEPPAPAAHFDLLLAREEEAAAAPPASEAKQPAEADPFTAHVIQIAEQFVLDIQSEGQFDFSVESLALVEELLERAASSSENPTLMKNLVNCVGCYIFEVARRNYGGSYYWYSPYDQPVLVTGQPDFEAALFAFEKVQDLLDGGETCSVQAFFQKFVWAVEHGRQEPGYRAMIF